MTQVMDHLGKPYDNIEKMCEQYEITRADYYHRKKKGWNLEKILTTKHVVCHKEITCHGQTFATTADFCRYYSITRGEYENRKAEGMTPEQIVASIAPKRQPTADQLTAVTKITTKQIDKTPIMKKYVDEETGVHYLITPAGGITPRLNADGSIMKDKD